MATRVKNMEHEVKFVHAKPLPSFVMEKITPALKRLFFSGRGAGFDLATAARPFEGYYENGRFHLAINSQRHFACDAQSGAVQQRNSALDVGRMLFPDAYVWVEASSGSARGGLFERQKQIMRKTGFPVRGESFSLPLKNEFSGEVLHATVTIVQALGASNF